MDAAGHPFVEGQQSSSGSGAAVLRGMTRYVAAAAPRREEATSVFDRLSRAVAQDVVPRLTVPAGAARRAQPVNRSHLAPSAVLRMAALALESDLAGAFAITDRLRARGMTVETIFLDLLAPAARHLGTLWNDDSCDFTQVTIGVGAIHHVLRTLAPGMAGRSAHGLTAMGLSGHSCLLVPAPGEQHGLGLAMVGEFLASAGWAVTGGTPGLAELGPLVRGSWFGVVGFSLGAEIRLESLRKAIRVVRDASCNRDVGIMVGGLVFVEHPELVAEVGADTTAADGREAVREAGRLLRAVSVCT